MTNVEQELPITIIRGWQLEAMCAIRPVDIKQWAMEVHLTAKRGTEVIEAIKQIEGWETLVLLLDRKGSAEYWGPWLMEKVREVGIENTILELLAIATAEMREPEL